jgi:formiminotetrahydrofolate cyclodeaminase
MYVDKPLREFLDELASKSAMPGGGSGAAVAGAAGAALLSMVCNLTIGKEKYRDAEPKLAEILEQSEAIRAELMSLVDADVEAYNAMMAAYRLPKETDEQKASRTAVIQEKVVGATVVPLRMGELCSQIIDLAVPVADLGNVNAISDAGVGVLLAEAGLHSAALNVKINLRSIKDAAFVANAEEALRRQAAGKAETRARVIATVEGKIA